MKKPLEIGVLALQGDFAAHAAALGRVGGCRIREVRRAGELAPLDGLILPGGESTTLAKLLRDFDLWEPLGDFAGQGKAIFGTCAGLILMAEEVLQPAQASLGLLPVSVVRNAYGRQVDSFVVPGRVIIPPDLPSREVLDAESAGASSETDSRVEDGRRASFPAEFVFIRAPRIAETREGVEILANHDDSPVLVRKGALLGASFHPELPGDSGVMRLFLALVRHVRRTAGVAR